MKKCKRLTCLLLAGMMLCGSLPGVPVYAEGEAEQPAAGQTEAPAAETPEQPAETTSPAAETTAVTTETSAVTTETTAVTTEVPAPALPEFSGTIAGSYPGGTTALELRLAQNPGIYALAMTVQLPAWLKPTGENGGVKFTAGPALTAPSAGEGQTPSLLYTAYNDETGAFSIVYAADTAADASAENGDLLLTVPLNISPEAVIGQKCEAIIKTSNLVLEGSVMPEEEAFRVFFTAQEPLLRAFPAELNLTKQDETAQLALDPLPPEGSCEWSSSEPETVSVSASGEVKALRTGQAVITVVCETRTYTCTVTADIAREIQSDTLTITERGGTLKLRVTPEPHSAVTWSSSDDSIASIGEDGTVTANGNGKVRILAHCDGIPFSAVITVDFPCTLNYREYAAAETGETVQLILEDAAADVPVTWSSSSPDIASVDEAGLVTILAEGEADITAEHRGRTYVCHVQNLPYLRGDADSSGDIAPQDAQRIQKHYNLVELLDEPGILTPIQLLAADADRNGIVDLEDAMLIQMYYNYWTLLDEEVTWDELIAKRSKR